MKKNTAIKIKEVARTIVANDDSAANAGGTELAERIWAESWTYIKTIVDTVHEPFLILNKKLFVMAANESFYRTFQVEEKDTENKLVYKLGNGQWSIPSLKKLLEEILPKQTFFKGFEVDHKFPFIGRKIMILNARQIHFKENSPSSPPIILLAMEDITEMISVAHKLANHTNHFESKFMMQTKQLHLNIKKMEKEINELKKSNS